MKKRRDWIVDSIGEQTFEQLTTALPGSLLQSVLLEVLHARARARTPAALERQYQRDGFCRPCAIDQRTCVAIDAELLAAAEGFEALELSPLTPLGTCSTVALTDQHRVVSAVRSTEVVADPTNVLALECARRLRADPAANIDLATSQRVVRAQPVPDVPGYAQHFRIFVLASAGPETADHGFSVAAALRHIHAMLGALTRLEQRGYSFGERRVDVLATSERAALGDRIAAGLGAIAVRKPLGHAYYSGGLRYMLWVSSRDGRQIPLGDGGTFDWLSKLGLGRRAVYLASGLGAQLIASEFANP
ncbi:MAG TPA: hypothetical protein VMG11_03280 [Steroidobacteraceae bacterium]|nr:hypothetical protein [Steroidobacteraceae bacterium]